MALEQIRGMYSWETTSINHSLLAENGCNTLIWSHDLQSETQYTTLQNVINPAINAGIAQHIAMVNPFDNSDGTAVDPSTEGQAEYLAEQCALLLENVPDLNGIVFNDFFYNVGWNSGGNQWTQNLILLDLAETVKTAVKDVDNDLVISAYTLLYNHRAAQIHSLANIFDIIMPELYRLTGTMPGPIPSIYGEASYEWVNDVLAGYIRASGKKCDIVPALITYTNESDKAGSARTVEDISSDVEVVLSQDIDGYSFFGYQYAPEGVLFPSSNPEPELVTYFHPLITTTKQISGNYVN